MIYGVFLSERSIPSRFCSVLENRPSGRFFEVMGATGELCLDLNH